MFRRSIPYPPLRRETSPSATPPLHRLPRQEAQEAPPLLQPGPGASSFRSDADVEIEERPEFFRFVTETDSLASGVIAHMVEIHPGVTKIVVGPRGGVRVWDLDLLMGVSSGLSWGCGIWTCSWGCRCTRS
ncbi:hypothetical protein MLD38_021987 [Melastoma candidum]|uniref:Uncharacterized protein n=1 Tax=Melastoma candidum TaxID=119954 RepID=A0ACB9QIR5_9MYRT|nr:hypothetical protein MLD38_021987 [Melastoma candidum]